MQIRKKIVDVVVHSKLTKAREYQLDDYLGHKKYETSAHPLRIFLDFLILLDFQIFTFWGFFQHRRDLVYLKFSFSKLILVPALL